MDRKQVTIELEQLNRQYYDVQGNWRNNKGSHKQVTSALEQMEQCAEAFLDDHPDDVDMLIKLALIVYRVPLADDVKAIHCLEQVFNYDSNNACAALILAYITTHFSYLDKDTFEILCAIRDHDNETMSMIAYAKSWYYEAIKDEINYKKMLIHSIELCDKHVKNYSRLASFYLKKGQRYQAGELLKKAARNIQHIYTDDDYYLIYDTQEFLKERLMGIHATDSQLKGLDQEFILKLMTLGYKRE